MGNIPPLAAFRHPPPPGRCLLIDSITETEGDTSIEILLRLSADDIYDNARLVCRSWRHLIQTDDFVRVHLHRTCSGLLLTNSLHPWCRTIFVTATTQGRVKISKLSCRVALPIVCSCNGLGLSLRKEGSGWNTPFIFNPTTKCAFDLPKFPVTAAASMAYTAASMAYKVFGSYHCKSGMPHFVMLTVGVDNEWRKVAVEGLSREPSMMLRMCCSAPSMTRGFLHWVLETHVVSLNVETEIFTLTPTPTTPDLMLGNRGYCHLSTGEHLSLFVSRGDWSWEVWEMKAETWEWRKLLPNLDLEAHKCKIQQLSSKEGDVLKPVGWVRYPKVLAFFFDGLGLCFVIYNLDTKEFKYVELSTMANHHHVVQHRNTLVWSEKW